MQSHLWYNWQFQLIAQLLAIIQGQIWAYLAFLVLYYIVFKRSKLSCGALSVQLMSGWNKVVSFLVVQVYQRRGRRLKVGSFPQSPVLSIQLEPSISEKSCQVYRDCWRNSLFLGTAFHMIYTSLSTWYFHPRKYPSYNISIPCRINSFCGISCNL